MLLLASRHDPEKDARVFTKTSWVQEKDRKSFLESGHLPEAVGKITLNWQQFWLVPAVMAVVILVLFLLTFRDKARLGVSKKEEAA